jgi:hypothetical protein
MGKKEKANPILLIDTSFAGLELAPTASTRNYVKKVVSLSSTSFTNVTGPAQALKVICRMKFTRQHSIDTALISGYIVEVQAAGDVTDDSISGVQTDDYILKAKIDKNFRIVKRFPVVDLCKNNANLLQAAADQEIVIYNYDLTKWWNKAQSAESKDGSDAHEFYFVLINHGEPYTTNRSEVYGAPAYIISYLEKETEMF